MQEVYHRRKIQSITDYRRATGFEALIGHLYLSEEYERLTELVTIGLEAMEEKFSIQKEMKEQRMRENSRYHEAENHTGQDNSQYAGY